MATRSEEILFHMNINMSYEYKYYKYKLKYNQLLDLPSNQTGGGKQPILMIHQVFQPFTKDKPTYQHISNFKIAVSKTKKWTKKLGIKYKLWNEQDCQQLINKKFPQYRKLYKQFRYKIQKIDFIRYCILYQYGGIYLDCDIHPIKKFKHLFNLNFFFVKNPIPPNKGVIYNAIMGTKPKNKLFLDILKEVERSTYEKQKKDIYKKWKGRLVFQTTGQYMLKRVLGDLKPQNFLNIISVNNESKGRKYDNPEGLFLDYNTSEWYFNRKPDGELWGGTKVASLTIPSIK